MKECKNFTVLKFKDTGDVEKYLIIFFKNGFLFSTFSLYKEDIYNEDREYTALIDNFNFIDYSQFREEPPKDLNDDSIYIIKEIDGVEDHCRILFKIKKVKRKDLHL